MLNKETGLSRTCTGCGDEKQPEAFAPNRGRHWVRLLSQAIQGAPHPGPCDTPDEGRYAYGPQHCPSV
jgi:hypothetical protein